MRIGVIGTGTIASAVVAGIAGDGHAITVSERGAARSAALAERYGSVTVAPNQSVLDRSDVVFLGLMAEAAPGVLGTLRFRPDHSVISLMAGVALDEVGPLVAPASAEAVVIPFPGIAQGGSPLLVRGRADLAHALFGARNAVFELTSDAELAAYLCAQAVLSPAALMVADASAWLGARVPDPVQGEAFLRSLVGSSLLGADCAALLDALDTPGGYNRRLRRHMAAAGIGDKLARGLDMQERGA